MKPQTVLLAVMISASACSPQAPTGNEPAPPALPPAPADPAPAGVQAVATFVDDSGEKWNVWGARLDVVETPEGGVASLSIGMSRAFRDNRGLGIVAPSLRPDDLLSLPRIWPISYDAARPGAIHVRLGDGTEGGSSPVEGGDVTAALVPSGIRFTIHSAPPLTSASFDVRLSVNCSAVGASGVAKGPSAPSADPSLKTGFCGRFAVFSR